MGKTTERNGRFQQGTCHSRRMMEELIDSSLALVYIRRTIFQLRRRCIAKVMRKARSSRPAVLRLFSEPAPKQRLISRASGVLLNSLRTAGLLDLAFLITFAIHLRSNIQIMMICATLMKLWHPCAAGPLVSFCFIEVIVKCAHQIAPLLEGATP